MSERPELSNPFTNGVVIGHNIDPRVYHRRDDTVKRGDPRFVMSRSELMTFAKNPWKWVMGTEGEETKSTEWGTLMDCCFLTPDRFDDQFVVAPESYPATKASTAVKEGECAVGDPIPWNGAAKFCKDWRKDQGDKVIVGADKMDDADRAVELLYQDTETAKVMRSSAKQVMVTAEYHDKQTSLVVPFKILIDLLPIKTGDDNLDRSILDFKTAQSVEPWMWQKQVEKFGYHVQAATYLDVYSAAVPNERDLFKHIAQENTAPFFPMRHELGEGFLRLGRELYHKALRKYCVCLAGQAWPGYEALPGQIVTNGWHNTSAPDWALK